MSLITLNKQIGELRTKYQKNINDIYIWSSIAFTELKKAKSNKTILHQEHFTVASLSHKRKIERTPDEIEDIFTNAINYEFYFSIFVYIVAQSEAFLFDLIECLLSNDHRRLKLRINGINLPTKIDVDEIIDSQNISIIIEQLISNYLSSIFYASPKCQLEYLNKITGIEIPEDIFWQWIEIKATRDIIVHNQGIVNSVYIEKTGSYARQEKDSRIVIDEIYYDNSLGIIKSLIGKISSALQRKYK
jgi:hypothetical protein